VVGAERVASAASAPEAPGIQMASAVPALPVAKGPDPAAEMHLTIPAQTTASVGLPLHGAVPPLPVRTVGALSATNDGAVQAEAAGGHAGHGIPSSTTTSQGGAAPMMPMGGAGAMAPRTGHHASSVHLSADPDAWALPAETPLAVLGRPMRPDPLPVLPPTDGTETKPEGDKNG
jgi:hypothetical protein